VAVAETFEKLAQALIAHAASLTSFANLYRGDTSGMKQTEAPAETKPAPTTRKPVKATPAPAANAGSDTPSTKEVQDFAVAWIKEGASEAAQTAIKAQVVAIVNKYGAQKIDQLPATALAAVHDELKAAKSGGGAAPSTIDI
jgi:hypothetical protein